MLEKEKKKKENSSLSDNTGNTTDKRGTSTEDKASKPSSMEKPMDKDSSVVKQTVDVTEKPVNKTAEKNSAKPAAALKQPSEKPNSQNTKMATNRNPNIATKNSTGNTSKQDVSKEINVLSGPKDVGSSPTSVSTLENRKGTPNRNKSEHVEISPDNNKMKDTDPPNNNSTKNGANPKLNTLLHVFS